MSKQQQIYPTFSPSSEMPNPLRSRSLTLAYEHLVCLTVYSYESPFYFTFSHYLLIPLSIYSYPSSSGLSYSNPSSSLSVFILLPFPPRLVLLPAQFNFHSLHARRTRCHALHAKSPTPTPPPTASLTIYQCSSFPPHPLPNLPPPPRLILLPKRTTPTI